MLARDYCRQFIGERDSLSIGTSSVACIPWNCEGNKISWIFFFLVKICPHGSSSGQSVAVFLLQSFGLSISELDNRDNQLNMEIYTIFLVCDLELSMHVVHLSLVMLADVSWVLHVLLWSFHIILTSSSDRHQVEKSVDEDNSPRKKFSKQDQIMEDSRVGGYGLRDDWVS